MTKNIDAKAKTQGLTPFASERIIPDHLRDRLSPVVMETYAAGDFHRADMRTIAREAGMSFRTIYSYFGDKEALLFWFIQHWLEGLYPASFKPLEGEGEVRTKLLGVLQMHLEFYERNPSVGRIIFMTVPLERWMRDPSYAQSGMMKRLLHTINEGQRQGELRCDIDSRVVLDAFNAIFNRAFLMWEYRRRSYSLSAQAAPLMSILWGGIMASGKRQDSAPPLPAKAPARKKTVN